MLQILILFLFSSIFGYSEIILSQVGYTPYEEKIAYYVYDKELIDLSFNVIDKKTNLSVLNGKMSKFGKYYEKLFYIVDFSELAQGEYLLKINNEFKEFSVRENIYRKLYLDTINSYFFIQRCGIEIPGWHKKCHLDDAIVPAANKKLVDSLILTQLPEYQEGYHIDVTGGWHDAGDYNKYMGNLAVAVAILGLAFEEFNLVEDINNNGIPDLLEELRYAVDWMLKMQDKDGGVFERVFSGYEYKGLPEKETDNKQKTSDDRYLDIDKFTDTAGKFLAATSICARIFEKYDKTYSQRILQAAFKTWDWIKKNPSKYDLEPWSFGRYPGDKSAVVWSAVEMYQTTKSFEFLDFAERRVLEVKAVAGSLNHMSWLFQPVIALSKIYFFTNHDGIKKVIAKELKNYFKKYIEFSVENPFYLRTGFIDAWEWGTNAIVLGCGFDLYWISKVLDDPSVLNFALKARQWVLGLNYIGKSFVVGIGNSVENPYSLLVQSSQNKKRVLGAVVPGLYISKGNPFYTEQQGSFKCNEATIDAAALYVFNVGLLESDACINLVSPKRNDVLKGNVDLKLKVLSKRQVNNVLYRIDDGDFKPLTKNNEYFVDRIDTTYLSEGEHIIYIIVKEKEKVLTGTFLKVNVDNVKEPLKVYVLSPRNEEVYIGGCEILCKINYEDISNYELYYSINNTKSWDKLSIKNKEFSSLFLPSIPTNVILQIKAIDLKTNESHLSEQILFSVVRSGRLQTEQSYKVLQDISQTPISQEKRKYDDAGCVVLPDENDSLYIDFFICQDGNYVLRHRERSGDVYWKSPISRWQQDTYEYYVDNKKISMKPLVDTVTKESDLYGEYWGIRESEKIYLNRGKHTFSIKTKQVWAYSDYLDVIHELDIDKKFTELKTKILDNFEKVKLDWGSYKGSSSELTVQISALNQKFGEKSLKFDFINKDYVGIVYNNNIDWSTYKNIKMWVYATQRCKIHFVIEERKEKTFWGYDYDLLEANKWINIELPFESFSVDKDYQPGNKEDKILNLEDVMTFHVSPRTQSDKKITIFIDDLRLNK
ncbi:MAG: glycoside hydrolase family 9 protein [Endomicrobia bacterium]|nr:glycoside hydrolase family 9 protein [Endomicrobiia bacterium]